METKINYVDADWEKVKASQGLDNIGWKKRIVEMVSFLDKDDKTVMDLGAGNRYLEYLLPDKNVRYIPVDIEKTSPDTIVCDFNRKQFPEKQADAIVAAGIIEYIEDPWWFLEKITNSCKKLIISHKGKEKYQYANLYSEQIKDYLYARGFVMTGESKTLSDWTMIACFEKIKPFILGKHLLCTGCGACTNACPVDALHMEYDELGFLKPQLDTEKCIECGKCMTVCDTLLTEKKKTEKDINVYAAWAEDEIRAKSSSGGAFTIFAQDFINRGGVVFGAVYNEEFRLVHEEIHSVDELDYARHSKYMQSDVGNSFRKVRSMVKKNIPVLYVGTHCQIAGLRNYLQDIEDCSSLLTVSLVCFGIPSNVLFRRYLEETYGKENVLDIEFRNKEKLGWSPFGYKVITKKQGELYPALEEDVYQKVFHRQYFRNDVCEHCRYVEVPMTGDLTLADFWGIKQQDRTWDDQKGTSLIMANSMKGKEYIRRIQGEFKRIQQVPLSWMYHKGNAIDEIPRKKSENYSYFMSLLGNHTIAEAYEIASVKKHNIGIVMSEKLSVDTIMSNYALYCFLKAEGYLVAFIYETKIDNENLFLQSSLIPQYDILYAEELEDGRRVCDIYIVGSGNQWSHMRSSFTMLDWVPSDKYKIAYATNGADVTEKDKRAELQFFLARFQHIFKLPENVDPLFLVDRKEFDKLFSVGRIVHPQGSFMTIYLSIHEKECQVIAEALKKNYTGAIEILPDKLRERRPNRLSVEEWGTLTGKCEYLVTDSISAVYMALLFHKPFAVLEKTGNQDNKIREFLSVLGLEKHITTNYNEIWDILNHEMNTEEIENKINRLAEESRQSLLKAIEEANTFNGRLTAYDVCRDKMLEMKKNIRLLSDKLEDTEQALRDEKRRGYQQIIHLYEQVGKPVRTIFFGVGGCFERHLDIIKKTVDSDLVSDNNIERQGRVLYNQFRCIAPEALKAYPDSEIVITVDNMPAVKQIQHQLTDLGCSHVYFIDEWLFLRGVKK